MRSSRDPKKPTHLVGVLAVALLVVALAFIGWQQWASRSETGTNVSAKHASSVTNVAGKSETQGWVDGPVGDTIQGHTAVFNGWALDPKGIRAIEVRAGGQTFSARYGIARSDIAAVKPGFPDSAASGWEFSGDFSTLSSQTGGARLPVEVVAINRDGIETTIGRRTIVPSTTDSPWKALWEARANAKAKPFYLVPGVSGIGLGGATELDAAYRAYESPTFGVGVRVPILYMRTTKGEKSDYVFDPDWDIERKCGDRRIAEDSLGRLITYAKERRLPVLFTLNGGVWGDASCGVPEWDLTDHLELDPLNVQWNEKGVAMADDALKDLPGAQSSPELARMLTYNVFADRVRFYKRRNLQSAAIKVVEFARTHPELFIGVNLDPDTTMNPFFEGHQWYDYNPGTLRQFRHWLAGTGPYAGRTTKGVPDLSSYRRKQPLTLAQVGRLADREFTSWDEVEPPRKFESDFDPSQTPFWKSPWHHEWEVFRRHVIDLHFDELSSWLVEAGVPASRIFSSQGFMPPHDRVEPFAINIESPIKNFDSGGVTIEGSLPRHGHIGAILYGPSAANDIEMETPAPLFATLHRFDPGWAVVEYNTADLRTPKILPTYEQAYRSFRDAFNYGARFISPMAWNGSNGIFAGQPGYISYMAWRNTPAEDVARDFALSHAYVPLGTRLWTFGTPTFASDDGFKAGPRTKIDAGKGRLTVSAGATDGTIVSPDFLSIRRGETDLLVLDVERLESLASVSIEVKDGSGTWRHAGPVFSVKDLPRDAAGIHVPFAWPEQADTVEQLRLRVRSPAPGLEVVLRHIALYPSPDAPGAK